MYGWKSGSLSRKTLIARKVRDLQDERGSIESGLVMIPVTILFLALIQIVVAGALQIQNKAELHSYLINNEVMGQELQSRINLKMETNSEPENPSNFTDKDFGGRITVENHNIFGLGQLNIARSERSIPTFLIRNLGFSEAGEPRERVRVGNVAISID
jgi:hypothetical protein